VTGRPVLHVELGDRLELRKPHPCGARTWTVHRLGADLGLVCDGCGRRLLLERAEVERRLVKVLPPAPAALAEEQAPG
jgi:hypothetical protein